MKSTIKILSVCVMLFAAIATNAQNLSDDAIVITAQRTVVSPVFKSLAYVRHINTVNLEFSVRKVQNVMNYRIEAGNDPNQLEYIGQIKPLKNNVLPTDFSFMLAPEAASYKYFRIVEVSMGQEWITSAVIERPVDGDSLVVRN